MVKVHYFFKGATCCDLLRLWSGFATLRRDAGETAPKTKVGKDDMLKKPEKFQVPR
jgi:hypothetical protein